MNIRFFILAVLVLGMTSLVFAQGLSTAREQSLAYGRVVYVTNITLSDSEIAPGSDALISVTIENIGDSELRDVILRLRLPSQFSPSIGDVDNKKLRTMKSGEIRKIPFNVRSLPTAASGIYPVELNIRYLNRIGDLIEENNTISLVIGDHPDLLVKIADSELHAENPLGEVTIHVINRGLIDVRFVTLSVLESTEFSLLSSSREYIGDVDSDDFEVANFDVKVSNIGGKERIIFPVEMTYRDANNKEYSQNLDLTLNIPKKDDVVPPSNNTGVVVFSVIVLVLFVWWLWARWKKKRRHAHHHSGRH